MIHGIRNKSSIAIFTLIIYIMNTILIAIPRLNVVKAASEIDSETSNLVLNNSFEDTEIYLKDNSNKVNTNWMNNKKPKSWDLTPYKNYILPMGEVDNNVKYSGNFSVKISSNDKPNVCFLQQLLKPVVPQRTYTVSARLKTENISENGITFRIEQLDNKNALVSNTQKDIMLLKGTNDWTEVKDDVKIDSVASQIKVVLMYGKAVAASGETTGTVWIDDVKVNEKIENVTSINLDKNDYYLNVGNSIRIEANINPIYATNTSLEWSSSNSQVASVDKSGQVTANKVGEAYIVASSKFNGNVSSKCKITVVKNVPVSGITLNKKDVTLIQGKNDIIAGNIEPYYAANNNITWSSSNPNVAKVENGLIISVGPGKTVITATTKDGQFTAKCNVAVTAKVQDEFDIIRLKWKNYLLGGKYDVNDPLVKPILEDASNKGNNLWNSMNKSQSRNYLWEDCSATNNSGFIVNNYNNLYSMTIAFLSEGSKLKGNPELLKDIISGLDWMMENRYKPYPRFYDNWWSWEIGCTKTLNNIVTLLYEYLSEDQIKHYMDVVDWYVPDPKYQSRRASTSPTWKGFVSTGANRADLSEVVVLRGILVKDKEKIIMGSKSVSDPSAKLLGYTEAEDGFYKDGSFIQHIDIPYTGSYGAVAIGSMFEVIYMLSDSNYSIDMSTFNIFEAIKKSFEPLMYKGIMMDMVNGRAISRQTQGDHKMGASIISSMIKYASAAPKDYSDHFKSLAKYWISSDTYRDYMTNNKDMFTLSLAREILNDKNIKPSGELTGHFRFPMMDRVVHRTNDYTLGLGLYSKRIKSAELDTNGENAKGYHTGDGMTYLYNADLGQFDGDFWPTVDPNRLPGTTVDTKKLADYQGGYNSLQTWVGGTSIDDKYGITGMYLDKLRSDGSNLLNMDLQAKKSWFMFDDEIVALGSGIKSSDHSSENRTIETIVENRKIKDSGDNLLTINNVSKDSKLGWNETIDNVTWAHLSGNVAGSDIGYYFPNKTKLNAKREARTASWLDINKCPGMVTDPKPVTRNYLTIWLDHGTAPKDSTYEYVLLPNKTKEAVKAYSEKPDITILSNTPDVQAVKENKLNILGANFWNDAVQKVDILTVDKKSSIMVKESGKDLEVSVSDPTMLNKGEINIEIDKMANKEILNNPAIKVVQLAPTIKFTVNVNGSNGASFTAKFEIKDNTKK